MDELVKDTVFDSFSESNSREGSLHAGSNFAKPSPAIARLLACPEDAAPLERTPLEGTPRSGACYDGATHFRHRYRGCLHHAAAHKGKCAFLCRSRHKADTLAGLEHR